MKQLALVNPAPLFLIVFFLSYFLIKVIAKVTTKRCLELMRLSGALSAIVYTILLLLNIDRPGFIWHDTANILSIVAAYANGQPLYHATSGAYFYSLFYGPTTFLVYLPFFAWRDPVPVIKFAIFVVGTILPFLLYCITRKWLSRTAAFAVLPVGVTFLLAYPTVLFAIRGDIWLLLFMSAALLVAVRWNATGWFVAGLGAGILSGLAIDVKATIAPVACLLLVIVYRRYGPVAASVFAVACAGSTLAEFCLPHISLGNYLQWLVVSGHQRILKSTCAANILASIFLLAPVCLIAWYGKSLQRSRDVGWLIPTIFFTALVFCIVSGSKDGAGGWHLWAMLPFALLAASYEVSLSEESQLIHTSALGKMRLLDLANPLIASRTTVVLVSVALSATITTIFFAARDLRTVRPPGDSESQKRQRMAHWELSNILAQHFLNNLAMGYGGAVTDYRSDLRYKIPMARDEYFFDENAVVEGIKAGIPVPPAVTERVVGCQDIWIVPHGEVPFSSLKIGVLPVSGTPYIFPDTIRLGFAATHAKFQQGQVYDLWNCKKAVAEVAKRDGLLEAQP